MNLMSLAQGKRSGGDCGFEGGFFRLIYVFRLAVVADTPFTRCTEDLVCGFSHF